MQKRKKTKREGKEKAQEEIKPQLTQEGRVSCQHRTQAVLGSRKVRTQGAQLLVYAGRGHPIRKLNPGSTAPTKPLLVTLNK